MKFLLKMAFFERV